MYRIIILLCLSNTIYTQNLVKNGDFEQNTTRQYFNTFSIKDSSDFKQQLKYWQQDGMGIYVHNAKHRPNPEEIERGYYHNAYTPHSGMGMVELLYATRTAGNHTLGGSSYLKMQLEQALQPQHKYQVSFWMNIRMTDGLARYPDLAKYFGISFQENMQKMNDVNAVIHDTTPLLIGSFVAKEWRKVSFLIEPTCPLQVFWIGWFYNETAPFRLPNNDNISVLTMYIDDVSIEEKQDTGNAAGSVTYPCNSSNLINDSKKVLEGH